MDGVGVFEQHTWRKLACWLASELKQVLFGPRVLPQYGGPREVVLLGGSSLTSWSFLCNSRLCFRVPLRLGVHG